MKALVLSDRERADGLALREVPEPERPSGWVLVRVLRASLNRVDVYMRRSGQGIRHELPMILGLDAVGEVLEADAESGLAPGQKVVLYPALFCGRCRYCTRGQENLCPQALYTGYDVDGGYAQWMVAWAPFVYPLPQQVPAQHLAPLLCAGIIGYRALRRANVPPGGRLLLVGFGSSAHLVLPLAKAHGYHVAVLSRSQEHQQLARSLGADWAGSDPKQLPWRADSAVLFAPSGALVPVALEALAPGGTLAVAGIHLSPIPPLDYHRHLYWERDLRSVTSNTREDGRQWLAEALELGIRPQVQLFPLHQAAEALLALKQGKINGTAVLMVE